MRNYLSLSIGNWTYDKEQYCSHISWRNMAKNKRLYCTFLSLIYFSYFIFFLNIFSPYFSSSFHTYPFNLQISPTICFSRLPFYSFLFLVLTTYSMPLPLTKLCNFLSTVTTSSFHMCPYCYNQLYHICSSLTTFQHI